jgi:hypothetical protein
LDDADPNTNTMMMFRARLHINLKKIWAMSPIDPTSQKGLHHKSMQINVEKEYWHTNKNMNK